ncbi:MAG TPA: J domain-containing protein [Gemmatimonadaceae bacterium]
MPINYDPKADYYALLCIEAAASPEDIKKAHRARIGELHPDRGGDSAQASAVNVARDVLCDPDSRRAYDQARRDWILECLRSPFIRAFYNAERRVSASRNAQGAATGAAGPPPQRSTAPDPGAGAGSAQRDAAPSGTHPFTPEEIKAAAARLSARLAAEREAEQKERATGQGSANAAPPDAAPGEQGKWRWGIVTEYTWDDVCKVVASGDWLGAIGLLGTALFVDRAIHQQANAAELATLDAAVAENQRERAITFIENVAGAIGAHFSLDRNEVAARAGAAARAARSPTVRPAAAPKRKKRRKRVPVAVPVVPVRVVAR